jgi:hypothetical protein
VSTRPAATLLRLYPARWRARYGDEFAALLEERPLGPFDVADILLGALDAHLHLRGLGAASQHAKGFAMSLRIGGYAAILGGILWFVGLVVASTLGEGGGAFMLAFAAGSAALLVALAGLSSFQARRYPRLVWAAFVVPAVGAVASVVGVFGMVVAGDGRFIADWSGWAVWAFGTVALIVGSALFAIATWRAHTLSRIAAGVLAAASLVVIPVAFGIDIVGTVLPAAVEPLVIVAGALAFAGGWVALGVSALRVDGFRPATVGGAA